MTELIGWLIVLGLAVAIVGIYMLSHRIKEHARDTAEIMLQSNEMMLAQLKRLTDPSAQVPDPTVGVILERRCAQRRARPTAGNSRMLEKRTSPGRRVEDYPPEYAGYLRV
jgi:hypothetical protein